MKPMHATVTRLTRCHCCAGKYNKRLNHNSRKPGNSAARQKAARDMRREDY